jgi:single-strand DNA-binding protein
MSINKVILVGNVGKDPTVRYFDKGVAKTTFPLATSETYTNQQGETITSTEWHNIVLWRALAEVAEKTVKKGSQVYIVGKIKTRSYVDKDGVNKYITEILADTFLLLEKKQSPGYTASPTNEANAQGTSGTGLNEPTSSYSASSANNAKDLHDNGVLESESNGVDDIPKNGPGISLNDDDLPF